MISAKPESGAARTIVIEAGRTELHYWRDIWRYRELLLILAWRDILVRYKQTVVGAAWAVLRPFLTMVVFTVVFGRLAGMPSEGVPYPLMVFAALLPWQLFSTSIAEAGNSLVSNASLISKVYFPRVIIPISSIGVCLIDFLVSAVIMVGLMLWYQYLPSPRVLFLPLLVVLALANISGVALWLAALNVKYRDFRHAIPFIVQLGLYVSPVGFSSKIVPEKWLLYYELNPLVGVIEGFRWCLLDGAQAFPVRAVICSSVISAVLLYGGVRYFRGTERQFADVI